MKSASVSAPAEMHSAAENKSKAQLLYLVSSVPQVTLGHGKGRGANQGNPNPPGKHRFSPAHEQLSNEDKDLLLGGNRNTPKDRGSSS